MVLKLQKQFELWRQSNVETHFELDISVFQKEENNICTLRVKVDIKNILFVMLFLGNEKYIFQEIMFKDTKNSFEKTLYQSEASFKLQGILF